MLPLLFFHTNSPCLHQANKIGTRDGDDFNLSLRRLVLPLGSLDLDVGLLN
jgi:hypothetical protein